MRSSRRSFLMQTATASLLGSTAPVLFSAEVVLKSAGMLVVATWPFAVPGNERAREVLRAGGPPLDAVEQGIRVVETGNNSGSVGLGGIPDAAGVVQLDACIMGPDHRAGSVAALEGFAHPISVARRVMEKTPHVLLVGEGARMFALQQGFESQVNDGAQKHAAWFEKEKAGSAKPPQGVTPKGHDTIAMLVLGPDGNIAGGCSTSGLAHKRPGRVGDSPIIGSGLYVDNAVGAAGATGLGENVMRYCGSFLVVEFMRQGLSPEEACRKTIERIAATEPPGANLQISFIALDKKGRFGAAGAAQGFRYCVTEKDRETEVVAAPSVSSERIKSEGGHQH